MVINGDYCYTHIRNMKPRGGMTRGNLEGFCGKPMKCRLPSGVIKHGNGKSPIFGGFKRKNY